MVLVEPLHSGVCEKIILRTERGTCTASPLNVFGLPSIITPIVYKGKNELQSRAPCLVQNEIQSLKSKILKFVILFGKTAIFLQDSSPSTVITYKSSQVEVMSSCISLSLVLEDVSLCDRLHKTY